MGSPPFQILQVILPSLNVKKKGKRVSCGIFMGKNWDLRESSAEPAYWAGSELGSHIAWRQIPVLASSHLGP